MEGYIGEIRLFAGNFVPENWAYCNGDILEIMGNEALYAITGSVYGGDGQSNFALPDLRGRSAVGAGKSNHYLTSEYKLGERKGTPTVALDISLLPSHTHPVKNNLAGNFSLLCNASEASTDDPTGVYLALADSGTPYSPNHDGVMGETSVNISSSTFTCDDTGGEQSHNNMQPYLATNYIICMQGDFPPRKKED